MQLTRSVHVVILTHCHMTHFSKTTITGCSPRWCKRRDLAVGRETAGGMNRGELVSRLTQQITQMCGCNTIWKDTDHNFQSVTFTTKPQQKQDAHSGWDHGFQFHPTRVSYDLCHMTQPQQLHASWTCSFWHIRYSTYQNLTILYTRKLNTWVFVWNAWRVEACSLDLTNYLYKQWFDRSKQTKKHNIYRPIGSGTVG